MFSNRRLIRKQTGVTGIIVKMKKSKKKWAGHIHCSCNKWQQVDKEIDKMAAKGQPRLGERRRGIVSSGVRPPPFLFYPTLFIKAPLILKIPDPHPFSNLYVSYIHFWCHGNVVDWHPIALLIYHFTYFQPEDIPIFSILFCKYKCTTWKSEELHPL